MRCKFLKFENFTFLTNSLSKTHLYLMEYGNHLFSFCSVSQCDKQRHIHFYDPHCVPTHSKVTLLVIGKILDNLGKQSNLNQQSNLAKALTRKCSAKLFKFIAKSFTWEFSEISISTGPRFQIFYWYWSGPRSHNLGWFWSVLVRDS